MSLVAICTLATKPRIVSLKTNINTAVMAPNPPRKTMGERSMSTARVSTTPTPMAKSCPIWRYPLMEWRLPPAVDR